MAVKAIIKLFIILFILSSDFNHLKEIGIPTRIAIEFLHVVGMTPCAEKHPEFLAASLHHGGWIHPQFDESGSSEGPVSPGSEGVQARKAWSWAVPYLPALRPRLPLGWPLGWRGKVRGGR